VNWTRILLAGVVAVGAAAFAAACSPTQRPDGGTGPLAVGAEVPALTRDDHQGQAVDLRALQGSPVLVYFYPRDGTPGCTKEACAIRDTWNRFEAAGLVVLGVSSDSAESHRKFAEEHGLPFSLIADQDHAWAEAFGVDLTMGMTSRVSFLIGRDATVAKVYPGVDPAVHASEVLSDVEALP
jgi:peroxiredoxin Q/BCP